MICNQDLTIFYKVQHKKHNDHLDIMHVQHQKYD